MRRLDFIAEDVFLPIGRVVRLIGPAVAGRTALDLLLDHAEILVTNRIFLKEKRVNSADQALGWSD